MRDGGGVLPRYVKIGDGPWSQFSPSIFRWVLGNELKKSGLQGKTPVPAEPSPCSPFT